MTTMNIATVKASINSKYFAQMSERLLDRKVEIAQGFDVVKISAEEALMANQRKAIKTCTSFKFALEDAGIPQETLNRLEGGEVYTGYIAVRCYSTNIRIYHLEGGKVKLLEEGSSYRYSTILITNSARLYDWRNEMQEAVIDGKSSKEEFGLLMGPRNGGCSAGTLEDPQDISNWCWNIDDVMETLYTGFIACKEGRDLIIYELKNSYIGECYIAEYDANPTIWFSNAKRVQ